MNPFSRSTKEMKGRLPLPEIDDLDLNVSEYDEILLLFPIWWDRAPVIINSFLEKYDFTNKTIILFATSGGGGLEKCANYLKQSVSNNTIIKDGLMLNGNLSKEKLISLINNI